MSERTGSDEPPVDGPGGEEDSPGGDMSQGSPAPDDQEQETGEPSDQP